MDEIPAKPPQTWGFKPGVSGNPGGRRPMPPSVKEAISANAEKATARMTALLNDDTAWGAEGWIDAKTQVKLAEVAMQRAYGPALLDDRFDKVAPTDPENDPHLLSHVLRQAYDALKAEGQIPEYINARRADQMIDVTPEPTSEPQSRQSAAKG